MEDGEFGDVRIGIRAEDHAQGRIVAPGALQGIVHADVHVHLPDILMGNLRGLQIYKYKAFKNEYTYTQGCRSNGFLCPYVR